jgi:hypothetical protein
MEVAESLRPRPPYTRGRLIELRAGLDFFEKKKIRLHLPEFETQIV